MAPAIRFAPALLLILSALMTGLPAQAANTGGSDSAAPMESAYAEAKAAVEAGRYPEALRHLATVVKAEPKNADAWNLMGYSNRKMNRLSEAARYYDIALKVDPDHIGALGNQGELFVELGDYDRARQNLKLIGAICGQCEEAIDLQAALHAEGQS